MVMTWAGRLGLYLFIRILKDGKDKRFDNVRDNPLRFFSFWTIQGCTIVPDFHLNSLPNNCICFRALGIRDPFTHIDAC